MREPKSKSSPLTSVNSSAEGVWRERGGMRGCGMGGDMKGVWDEGGVGGGGRGGEGGDGGGGGSGGGRGGGVRR